MHASSGGDALKENVAIYVIAFLSLISLLILRYNKYLKYSVLTSYVMAIIYITFSNRSYSYYLVILYPYFTSMYFLVVAGISPLRAGACLRHARGH